jgi:hypothetical protein
MRQFHICKNREEMVRRRSLTKSKSVLEVLQKQRGVRERASPLPRFPGNDQSSQRGNEL